MKSKNEMELIVNSYSLIHYVPLGFVLKCPLNFVMCMDVKVTQLTTVKPGCTFDVNIGREYCTVTSSKHLPSRCGEFCSTPRSLPAPQCFCGSRWHCLFAAARLPFRLHSPEQCAAVVGTCCCPVAGFRPFVRLIDSQRLTATLSIIRGTGEELVLYISSRKSRIQH